MGKPKVVHVLNVFRPGAIPHILRNIYPFVRADYDFEVVALEGVERDTAIDRQFRELEIPVHAPGRPTLGMKRHYGFLKDQLRLAKGDIVHAHMGRAILLTPFCAPAGTRLCATFHGMREGFHPLSRIGLKATMPRLDAMTFVSEAVARSWGAARFQGTSVVPNPIDLERFAGSSSKRMAKRAEFGIPDDVTVLTIVGRLVPAKGHAVLLEALFRLRQSGIDAFRLLVVGKGNEESDLRAKVRALDLDGHVHFAGFRDDIPDILAASDICLLPSLWEGFGLAAVEAMAVGKPVIGSDLPGIREYLTPDDTGLVCPPGDPDALAAAIKNLLSNADLREHVAQRGQAFVTESFNNQSVAKKYLDVYDRVIGKT